MQEEKYDRGSPDADHHELAKPESCFAAGLECRSCVQHSAANLAMICRNLQVEEVRDSFFKIYPDQACLPMSRTFARAYRAADGAEAETEESLDRLSLLTVLPA